MTPALLIPAGPGEPLPTLVSRPFERLLGRDLSPAQTHTPALLIPAGPGEPLPTLVRRPFERLLGRDLSRVRTHISTAPLVLDAEAFTSGRHVVFAPGRRDLRSPRGLTLLGHELAHLGQSLGLSARPGARRADVDPDERRALKQEDVVRRLVERGWPDEPVMKVRRQAGPVLDSGVDLMPEVARPRSTTSRPGAETTEALAVARLRPAPASPPTPRPASDAGPDLEELSQQVYQRIRARLVAERDRRYPAGHRAGGATTR